MTSEHCLVRREFLSDTLAGVGGLLLFGKVTWSAESQDPAAEVFETDHFWYRLQPAGMYIDTQRTTGRLVIPKERSHCRKTTAIRGHIVRSSPTLGGSFSATSSRMAMFSLPQARRSTSARTSWPLTAS